MTAMSLPRITPEWLREHGAFCDQVAIFEGEWGADGADWTAANLRRAVVLGLDIHWLTDRILPAPHRRALEEALAPHRRALDEAVAPHRRAFREAVAPHQRAFHEAQAQWLIDNVLPREPEATP